MGDRQVGREVGPLVRRRVVRGRQAGREGGRWKKEVGRRFSFIEST